MPTKLRIKFKTFELEFEGEDKFAKADLLELMDKVHSLAAIIPDGSNDDEHDDKANDDEAKDKTSRVKGDWSTSKVAQKIGGKTCTQLATAALAYLCIIKKLDLASRRQIIDEMKLATSFYRDNFGNSLTSVLQSLVKSGKIHENGTNNFALSEDSIKTIKGQLAK
jgi:hypothetical protein